MKFEKTLKNLFGKESDEAVQELLKNIEEGTEVIVEEVLRPSADEQTKNPFTPQMFRRR